MRMAEVFMSLFASLEHSGCEDLNMACRGLADWMAEWIANSEVNTVAPVAVAIGFTPLCKIVSTGLTEE